MRKYTGSWVHAASFRTKTSSVVLSRIASAHVGKFGRDFKPPSYFSHARSFTMATQSSAIESLSKLKWNYSPEQIASEQASIVAKATQVLDKVGACTGAACTFENVVDPLMRLDAEIEAATSSVTFVKDVSTDGAVRDAAAAAQSALSAFEVKVSETSRALAHWRTSAVHP